MDMFSVCFQDVVIDMTSMNELLREIRQDLPNREIPLFTRSSRTTLLPASKQEIKKLLQYFYKVYSSSYRASSTLLGCKVPAKATLKQEFPDKCFNRLSTVQPGQAVYIDCSEIEFCISRDRQPFVLLER